MPRWTRIAAPPRPTRETNGGNRCAPKHWQARDRAPPATRRPRGSRRTGPSRAATDARKLLALHRPALALRMLRLLQRQRPVTQAIRGRFAFVRAWGSGARRGDQLFNPIGQIPRGPACHAADSTTLSTKRSRNSGRSIRIISTQRIAPRSCHARIFPQDFSTRHSENRTRTYGCRSPAPEQAFAMAASAVSAVYQRSPCLGRSLFCGPRRDVLRHVSELQDAPAQLIRCAALVSRLSLYIASQYSCQIRWSRPSGFDRPQSQTCSGRRLSLQPRTGESYTPLAPP